MTLANFFQVLGGVGIFLYGIKLMSDALQCLAGDNMRRLIGTLTRTPLRGVFVGALVTVLIQSSSATTVMTVSFVHAGLMNLAQSIGVIMGANIGTTVTAQIIAFNIKGIAYPFIAVGAFMVILGKSKKQKYIGTGLMGFGFLFMGMQIMEGGMFFLRDQKELFLRFNNPVYGLLAGTILTVLVQSSAATIGLTMVLASQGLLTLDGALPIILGDNIGTTITAVLASIGTSRAARQAAAAHVLFNLIGALIFLAALPLYHHVVLATAQETGRQIANAHTIFNVCNTLLFLPFVGLFARFIRWLIPVDEGAGVLGPLYLDDKLAAVSPTMAVEAVKNELVHMGESVMVMTHLISDIYKSSNNEALKRDFEKYEAFINGLNRSVSKYAAEIWQHPLAEEKSAVLGRYVTIAGDFERIGDHLENLLELSDYKLDNNVHFTAQADAEFWDMFADVQEAIQAAVDALAHNDMAKADRVLEYLEAEIDRKEKVYRANHIERLTRQECDPERGVIFADVLSNLERMGDHSYNIAGFVRGR